MVPFGRFALLEFRNIRHAQTIKFNLINLSEVFAYVEIFLDLSGFRWFDIMIVKSFDLNYARIMYCMSPHKCFSGFDYSIFPQFQA